MRLGRLTPALLLFALMGIVHLLCNFTMMTSDCVATTVEQGEGLSAVGELVNTNWQTTAAIGLTVASGGVLGAISLAAFPAQTLAAGTSIGVLAYAGQRRADGKTALPFLNKEEEAKSEAKAAA